MDYLDPNKKKNKKIRLMIGYSLLGVAISIATIIFVYLTNGYYIDDTGNVIQNGLIYLDSKPESAEIYLNGEKQRGATDARLVVPEGIHDIKLTRADYRDWNRKITLEGGSLRRLTYARMVPNTIDNEQALALPGIPNMTSHTIDARWLVMAFDDNPQLLRMVDLNRAVFQIEEIPLPLELVNVTETGKWEILDWADDNRTFLAKYQTGETVEYALIDREAPAESVNLKTVFSTTEFNEASMRDRKNDLVFLHNEKTGALYRANVTNGEVEPYVEDVVDYVAFGNDAILYVTKKDATAEHVKAVLKNKDEEYPLREIKQDSKYFLELAKLGNAFVMGVGSSAEGRVIVYNDPINAIKQNDFSKLPVPTTVLRVNESKPVELSISSDSSVILMRAEEGFSSHEFEEDRSYKFKLEDKFDEGAEIRWMDGQHFTYSSNGKKFMSDFDGSNNYELFESVSSIGIYFDPAIDHGFSFLPPAQEGAPARLMRNFMRTVADR